MTRLWIRNEVFDGVLPLKPSGLSTLTTTSVPSLLELLRAMKAVHPKTVRYTTWITEGWRVLHWSEPSAKLLWEMTSLYHLPLDQSASPRSKREKLAEMPISQLGLFMFLHVHPDSTSHKIGASRPSHVDSVWPAEEVSPPPSRGQASPTSPLRPSPKALGKTNSQGSPGGSTSPVRGSPSKTRSLSMKLRARTADEAHRLSFIKRHLTTLLQVVCCNPEGYRDDEDDSFSVGLADLEALRFLIAGGEALEAPESDSLGEVCPLWRKPVDPNKTYAASEVVEWLSKTLTVNEIVYPAPPSPAAALIPEAHDHDHPPREGSPDKIPVRRASGSGPISCLMPERASSPLLVNCVIGTTVMHSEGDVACTRDLQINHCREAYIYILAPVKNVTILGCTECTIVVGAAAGLVRVAECERIQVIVACKRIMVTNSHESVFPIFTSNNPVLSGDNRTCQFAPYNACYPMLRKHLLSAGLAAASPPATNLWHMPIDVTTIGVPNLSLGYSRESKGKQQQLRGPDINPGLMQPEAFFTLTIPCPSEHSNQDSEQLVENPFALPEDYAAVLRARDSLVGELQMRIQESGLSQDKQAHLEDVVKEKFTEWLVSSGNLRQVWVGTSLQHSKPSVSSPPYT
ncbi:unnamed protein product [Chrysoparadoxa australica]